MDDIGTATNPAGSGFYALQCADAAGSTADWDGTNVSYDCGTGSRRSSGDSGVDDPGNSSTVAIWRAPSLRVLRRLARPRATLRGQAPDADTRRTRRSSVRRACAPRDRRVPVTEALGKPEQEVREGAGNETQVRRPRRHKAGASEQGLQARGEKNCTWPRRRCRADQPASGRVTPVTLQRTPFVEHGDQVLGAVSSSGPSTGMRASALSISNGPKPLGTVIEQQPSARSRRRAGAPAPLRDRPGAPGHPPARSRRRRHAHRRDFRRCDTRSAARAREMLLRIAMLGSYRSMPSTSSRASQKARHGVAAAATDVQDTQHPARLLRAAVGRRLAQ